MTNVRLSIRNLGKAFSVPVLKGVSIGIAQGEIHALVGENGAGKSTLINILAGLVAPDAGEVLIDGERYSPANAGEAFAAGVSFAAQELCIIETLSVAENIGLRALPARGGVIARASLEGLARRLLDKAGLQQASPSLSAGELSLGEKQLVEIARAISSPCRLLMLDEPTAALTSQQTETVHGLIRELAANGTAIIYVSHRLDDVLNIADRVTVLRDGKVVSTTASVDLDTDALVARMSGDRIESVIDREASTHDKRPSLSAIALTTEQLPQRIDLDLAPGEIVGIAGLAGAGKSELLAALFGLHGTTGGEVRRQVGDEAVSIVEPGQAVRAGIGYLGEDRRSMGIFPGQSVLNNMMLPNLDQRPLSIRDGSAERRNTENLRRLLSIQYQSPDQDIRQLSGGNQQKVLLARWLNCGAAVLLLDEPTRGVDVATKFAIHGLFGKLRSDGKTLLIASSELDELMAVCDRIMVMSDRHLVGGFRRGHWSEHEILAAAFSKYTKPAAASGEAAAVRS